MMMLFQKKWCKIAGVPHGLILLHVFMVKNSIFVCQPPLNQLLNFFKDIKFHNYSNALQDYSLYCVGLFDFIAEWSLNTLYHSIYIMNIL